MINRWPKLPIIKHEMDMTIPPVQVTFAPLWWRHHYSMSFDEKVLCNPIVRTEREREQRRLLFERFGDVGLGERDPQPHPMVDGAYGHRFMAALWGCEIIYLPDQAPAAVVLPDAAARMHGLDLPDLGCSDVVRKYLVDARTLQDHYGGCDGAINLGGPLNNAVSVLGEAMLAACAGEPAQARAVLMRMAEACLWVFDHLVCRVNRNGANRARSLGIGNCPVCMISPRTYERVVLPVDRWYREHFDTCALHHCGIFHPYAQVYQPLRPDHLDVGWGTELRRVRAAFPTHLMSIEIQARALLGTSIAELDAMVMQLLQAAAPVERITHLWVAEVGPDVPDDIIRHLVTAPYRLAPLE